MLTTKQKLILIVDDDAEDVELLTEVLQEVDPTIRCLTATDGQHALDLLAVMNTYPDFIFLDLNMPRLNGIQCLTTLKSLEYACHIPVIIYSTSKLKTDIEKTKALGAAYFLTKPTKMEDIQEAVAFIVQGKLTQPTSLKKILLVL